MIDYHVPMKEIDNPRTYRHNISADPYVVSDNLLWI